MNSENKLISIEEGNITFNNLVASGDVVGDKKTVTAKCSEPAEAVARSNARGDLCQVRDFHEVDQLGQSAAESFRSML